MCGSIARLSHPSDSVFAIGMKSWVVFDCIKGTPELSSLFFHSRGYKEIFTRVVLSFLSEDLEYEAIPMKPLFSHRDTGGGDDLTCPLGHRFGRHLIIRFF